MTEPANYPRDCWYVAATTDEVGHSPIGRTLLDQPVVLYRTEAGDVVALADRCPHRGYPLSRGRLENDLLVCGYHGFRYNAKGSCVKVPSQPNVPYGASVAAYPIREQHPYIWIWLGDPRRSAQSPIPELPWLTNPGWSTSGTTVHVAANYMLVHELHLDLSHTAEIHPVETPVGWDEMQPSDTIVLSETVVSYERKLPVAPLAEWEAEWTGLPRNRNYTRTHHASFFSPAVSADSLTYDDAGEQHYEVARVHALTPESPTTTHLFWQVAHNNQSNPVLVSRQLHDVLGRAMRRNVAVTETIQNTVGYDQTRHGINVKADAAALRARRTVDAMVAAEGLPRTLTARPTATDDFDRPSLPAP